MRERGRERGGGMGCCYASTTPPRPQVWCSNTPIGVRSREALKRDAKSGSARRCGDAAVTG